MLGALVASEPRQGPSSGRGGIIRPDLRCGPELKRDEVKVLDVSELSPERAAEFIESQVGGPWEVVREIMGMRPSNLLDEAWKRARREAAKMGCRYVVILDTRREQFGTMATDIFDPKSPHRPTYKNVVDVLFVQPRSPVVAPAPVNVPTAPPERARPVNEGVKSKAEIQKPSQGGG